MEAPLYARYGRKKSSLLQYQALDFPLHLAMLQHYSSNFSSSQQQKQWHLHTATVTFAFVSVKILETAVPFYPLTQFLLLFQLYSFIFLKIVLEEAHRLIFNERIE